MTLVFGTALLAGGIMLKSLNRLLRRKTREQFTQQFMECLETIVSALKAGSSFLQALTAAHQQSEEPLANELAIVLDEYRLGMPIEDSLQKLSDRIQLEELQNLVAAIRIAQASGGSLASIIQHLSKNLREQQQLKLRIASLAAQGKLQGLVTFFLPYVLLMIMTSMEPGLMKEFFLGPVGEPVMATILLAQVLAFCSMQAITEIKV